MTGKVTGDEVIQKLVQDLAGFLETSRFEPLFAVYRGGILGLARDLAETLLEQSGPVLRDYYLNGVKQKDLPVLDDQLGTLPAEG